MSREPARIVERYNRDENPSCNRALDIDDFERLLKCAEKTRDDDYDDFMEERLEDRRREYLEEGKERLFREIQKLDFAIVDAKLYLNTHPDDKRAMTYFDRHQRLHQMAVEVYEAHFGPLTTDGIDTRKDGWSWTEAPWPWQMEV